MNLNAMCNELEKIAVSTKWVRDKVLAAAPRTTAGESTFTKRMSDLGRRSAEKDIARNPHGHGAAWTRFEASKDHAHKMKGKADAAWDASMSETRALKLHREKIAVSADWLRKSTAAGAANAARPRLITALQKATSSLEKDISHPQARKRGVQITALKREIEGRNLDAYEKMKKASELSALAGMMANSPALRAQRATQAYKKNKSERW